MSIKILIDSASDISIKEASKLGIEMIPLLISFDQEEFYDGVDLEYSAFYKKLQKSSTNPTTSQITPSRFEEVYKRLTISGDEVIVITISSKLSGTYQSAKIASNKYPGKVYVVDSTTAAAGERILMMVAKDLIDQGLSASSIVEKLNKLKERIRILAVVDTLEYLKRGGRISKAVCLAGGILSIKPILKVKDGEITMAGKALGTKKAYKLLNKILKEKSNIDYSLPHGFLWNGLDHKNLNKYLNESKDILTDDDLFFELGCTIGTHTGPGVVGIAYFKKE